MTGRPQAQPDRAQVPSPPAGGQGGARRALVTGGAGFIGSHLAARLLEDGWQVRILDDFSSGRPENLEALPASFDLVRADVRNPHAVAEATSGVDVVFHLAAQVYVTRSVADPAHTYEVNAVGTANVLQACLASGTTRFVFSSSCAVYGESDERPRVETMEPDPLSPYASSKLTGEHLVRMFHRLHGMNAVSLRYFNVFGPRQDPASEYAAVIPRFISRMIRNERPVIFGDGRQTRDFVCVHDVVDANLAAACTTRARGQALNVGSGRSTDLLGLVASINAVLGTRLEPVHEAARAGDIRFSLADISRAWALLGWSPRRDPEGCIAETAATLGNAGGRP